MVRFKNRYLVVDVLWRDGKVEDATTEAVLIHALRDSIAVNFGDYGLGSSLASVQVRYWSPLTCLCVLRCATADIDKVVTSLSMTTDVKLRKAVMQVLVVAGTIKTCREAAVQLSLSRLPLLNLTRQQRALAQEQHAKLAEWDG